MQEYSIYWTETFKVIFEHAELAEQRWILKMEQQLKSNPYGKILRYSWFREKKFGDKRLYFLVEESQKKILFVRFGNKKDQASDMTTILRNMHPLLAFLKNL